MRNNPYRAPAPEADTAGHRRHADLPVLTARCWGLARPLTWLAGIAVIDFDPVVGGVMVLWG